MLTSAIISPLPSRIGELSASLRAFGDIRILRAFQRYPSEEEFSRFLQLAGPAIVFLDTEDTRRAIGLALAIDRAGSGAQVIGMNNECNPQVLVESMQAGIREFLSLPIEMDRLGEAVQRITSVLERRPLAFRSTDDVFSFLPAKPGDGASTVAVNVSSAIARRSTGKTLLADFDLNLGMVSFLLKITNGRSVLDALNLADRMDETLWNNLVLKYDGLDVLCSGRLEPRNEVELSSVDNILHFARRAYGTICLDLSGNMEPFSIALLNQSKEIFLVCTSDIPSLHFARARAQFLRESGLGERTSIVINRSETMSQFTMKELEKLLGLRIRFSFQNDPRSVSTAMHAGTTVNLKSALGRQFDTFAQSVVPLDSPSVAVPRKRRFIEYFAIVPPSYEGADQKRR